MLVCARSGQRSLFGFPLIPLIPLPGGVRLCEPINEPQGLAVKSRLLQWIWAVCRESHLSSLIRELRARVGMAWDAFHRRGKRIFAALGVSSSDVTLLYESLIST